MAFSPARRSANGVSCRQKRLLEVGRSSGQKALATVASVTNPILFVTQVPTAGEIFASRTSIFANHRPEIESVPRGGDLMICYPDGVVKNLTALAGFGLAHYQIYQANQVRAYQRGLARGVQRGTAFTGARYFVGAKRVITRLSTFKKNRFQPNLGIGLLIKLYA